MANKQQPDNQGKLERMSRLPAEEQDDVTLNNDGTVLGAGGGGGGGVRNPTAEAATRDLPIGGATGTLAEMGQRRTEIPGIAGGASTNDRGASGWLDGDPSNIGAPEPDNYTGDGPRLDKQ